MISDFFLCHTADYNLQLTGQQQTQFSMYLALLLEWNGRMNLTAVRKPEAIEQRHFLDALSCMTVMGDLNGRALIDVGTGAGFPGLPLKVAFPESKMTLVESVAKKCRFLEAVVSELGLSDVQVITERVELIGQQAAHRARYDWAVARGLAEMRVLAEYLLPLCRVGGTVLAQKGESAAGETVAAANAIHLLGGGKPTLYPVQIPGTTQTHHLVTVPKIANTPDKYPRRVGLPTKRPL
ncbi:MAG: 16S rRNA (guanine(527)-N(7))-methyltransferase RsmG [Chloroflexi bacterium]|nr:16S rRNA (guanine(527)-N(7))-methyltransferase RsmG [Chloroflexota bacterium]